MDQELAKNLGLIILTTMVSPIIVHYAQTIIDGLKKRRAGSENPLSEAIKVNNIISEKLEQVREAYGADRVWSIQFHNGGHFYPTGKSIQKFSMVHEILNPGIFPCQSQLQNIPVSLFSKTMDFLEQGVVIKISSFSEESPIPRGITTEVRGSGIKSTYLVPIFNIKGEFVAVVGVDYVEKEVDLGQEDLNYLEVDVSTIGGVLNNYLKV